MRKILLAASLLFLVLTTSCTFGENRIAPRANSSQAVVLIPGYGGGWGWSSGMVAAAESAGKRVIYADVSDMKSDLNALSKVVSDQVLLSEFNGVDLIGYSAGGVLARKIAMNIPERVHKVITLASPHNGSKVATFGSYLGSSSLCPKSCTQLSEGSDFIKSLSALNAGERLLNIYVESDEVVEFKNSVLVGDVINFNLTERCSISSLNHSDLPRDSVVLSLVSSFLNDLVLEC
ncbi:MAG: lipase family alpha/beta hydrolase [Candidatus Paceibacterota bacterium]